MIRRLLLALLLLLPSSVAIGKESIEETLQRCAVYKDEVQRALRDYGVSEDFYYLMVAESRCKPQARSDKGAIGMWQMMPRTLRYWGGDENTAAARYLRDLSLRFKEEKWIVAAWNCGGHNLRRIAGDDWARVPIESKSLYARMQRYKEYDKEH